MQEERSEIHVDRADNCGIVVRNDGFRVQEAGTVLVYFDARAVELLIVRARNHVDELLVRNARRQDADVHTRLRRDGQRGDHLVVEHEVRRCDIDVLACVVDDLEVGGLTDVQVVERRVGEGLHPAVLRQLDRREIAFEIRDLLARDVLPHLEKERGHIGRALAAQQYAGILPVAEAHLLVDVFIGEVDAAHIAGIAVDDHHLPVISVVEVGVERRNEAVEAHRADAERHQIAVVVLRQGRNRTYIVIDNADVHALLGLARQDVEDGVPHLALLDDEILKKDELFRFFKLFAH